MNDGGGGGCYANDISIQSWHKNDFEKNINTVHQVFKK